MRKISLLFVLIGLVTSCSTLPNPSSANQSTVAGDAATVLRKSAIAQGDSWKKAKSVKVEYSGEWTNIAIRVQPILTDPGFRKSSIETYQPPRNRVEQIHIGPMGKKEVIRENQKTSVRRNGVKDTSQETLDSSALVADAYTAFLFGSSWLLERGRNFKLLGDRTLNGESCTLVAGKISPGLGVALEDDFIAWISKKSGYMLRFQFSLNGFETTQGADVDVVFSDFITTSGGFVFPQHFLERIQRPIAVKAHEWRMTSLKAK